MSFLGKHLFLCLALVLFVVGSAAGLALQPSLDLVDQLEEAQVSCGRAAKVPLPDWRGYFWGGGPETHHTVAARFRYAFDGQRRTVMRLVARGGERCRVVLPARRLPDTLYLGTGFPAGGPRIRYERSPRYQVKVLAGEQELFSHRYAPSKVGWSRMPVQLGSLAGQRQPLTLEIDFLASPRSRVGVFLNLTGPLRLGWAEDWAEQTSLAARITWWLINWVMSFAVVFFLWGILAWAGFFEGLECRRRHLVAFLVVTVCLMTVLAWNRSLQQTGALHFLQNADSFLRGTTAVATHTPMRSDYLWYEGIFYAPNPPFVGVMMMPVIAVIGMKLNDVVFTLAFTGFNFVLLLALLGQLTRRGASVLSTKENLFLSFAFCFATPLLTLGTMGCVWQTAQVISVTLILVALGCCASPVPRPLLAGIALGAAFLVRPPVMGHGLLCFSMLAAWIWQEKDSRYRRLAWQTLQLCAGPALAFGCFFALNYVRFGSIWETGYKYLGYANTRRYGTFHPRFLKRNATIMLWNWPTVSKTFPYLHFNLQGNTILATVPEAIFALFPRRISWLWLSSMLTTVLCLMPALLYAETGWKQFGFRRLSDALPALFVWLALGRRRLGVFFWVIAILAVLVNLLGVYWTHGPDWKWPDEIMSSY